MLKIVKTFFLLVVSFLSHAQYSVWINEFSYDDQSTDDLEFVEIAGVANTDLKDYKVYFMNGNISTDAVKYQLSTLADLTIPNEKNGFGAVLIPFPQGTFQNGPNDGLALVYKDTLVVQFISYEGKASSTIFTNGTKVYESYDIPFSQSNQVSDDTMSIQLTGSEYYAPNFTWTKAKKTPGFLNENQNPKAVILNLNERNANHSSSVVFPQPLITNAVLQFSNSVAQKVFLRIFDVNANVILTKETYMEEFSLQRKDFDKAGVYFYQLQIGETINSGKIVVE